MRLIAWKGFFAAYSVSSAISNKNISHIQDEARANAYLIYWTIIVRIFSDLKYVI